MKVYDNNMNQLDPNELSDIQKSVYERYSYFTDAEATMYTTEPLNLIVRSESRAIIVNGRNAATIKSNHHGRLDVHTVDWSAHTKWDN